MRLAILLIHICAGIVGLLSGIAAVSFRKGSARHGTVGNTFFVSMVIMAVTAALLGNVFAGAMTIYLVTTGWLTGRRRAGETTIFDWGALLFGLAIGLPILIAQKRVVAFVGGPQLFFLLAPVPLILIIFWLIRIRFKNAYKRKSVPSGDVRLLPT